MWCSVKMHLVAYWAPLNLYYCLLKFAMQGLIKPDMHHTCLCIMTCLCLCVYYVVCFFPGCFLVTFGFVPELWGFVRLRPFVFFMDSIFFLVGFQARWSYPRNHFYLCLLSCSLFCYAYAAIPTTCLSCLPYCWTKPLTHLVLANRYLAMLPLCSAPLIALLVAGEDWSLFLVGTWRCCSLFGTCLFVGISQYILFN